MELQKNQILSFLYFVNDLYNQFQLNANITYINSEGNYFTNQTITENSTLIEYFFLPQNISNFNLSLKISKYLSYLKSKIQLKSNYAISYYKNIVNNSNLRQNKSKFLSNTFSFKTAFELPFNLENNLTYQYSNSKSEKQSAFTNKSIHNTFNLIFKPLDRWIFMFSSDYFLPNTEQSTQRFIFIDAYVKYKPKSKKWGASLTIRNITNENNFEQVQTTDISTTIFRSNLLPRYFLLNLTWNF